MEKNRYLKECKQFFPYIRRKDKHFFSRLDASLDEFIENNKSYSYDDLLYFFGTPKEVVISYFESSNDDFLLRKIKIISLCKKIILILMILSIVGKGLIIIYSSLFSRKENNV